MTAVVAAAAAVLNVAQLGSVVVVVTVAAVQIVHGGVDCVNFLCDAPPIRAISFVGGDAAGTLTMSLKGSFLPPSFSSALEAEDDFTSILISFLMHCRII